MQGHTEGDGDSYHTAPNYAKLAYLVLNKGVWDGEQLLDPTYIAGPGGSLDLGLIGSGPFSSAVLSMRDVA